MSKEPGLSAPGLLCAARAGYGALLLCAPRRMAGLAGAGPVSGRAAAVVRVLGARHLLQAALTGAVLAGARPPAGLPSGLVRPGPVLLAGAAADAAHAASMIALALAPAGRTLRRAALADAALESGLSAFGIMTARQQRHG